MKRLCAFLAACLALGSARAQDGASGEELFARGKQSWKAGAAIEAAEIFRMAADRFRDQSKPASEAASLYNFAMCCHRVGNFKLAYDALDRALKCVDAEKHPDLRRQVLGLAGTLSVFTGKTGRAEEFLLESLQSARDRKDAKSEAWLLNDIGILMIALGEWTKARSHFDQCAILSARLGLRELRAKTLLNRCLASLNARTIHMKQPPGAEKPAPPPANLIAEAEAANAALAELAEGHERALGLLTLSEIWQRMRAIQAASAAIADRNAFHCLTAALRIAQQHDLQPLLSQGLGMMAEMYRLASRLDEAERLNASAIRIADAQGVAEDLFRWQWQRGRLLRARGQRAAALDAYATATNTLTRVRHDIAVGYGNRDLGLSFRESVGDLFYERADLILQGAVAEGDDAMRQSEFVSARGVIEELKSAELVDYFQDSCISLLRSMDKDVSSMDTGDAAVIYIIPLADSTELLISHKGRTERFRSPMRNTELDAAATAWRSELEDHQTQRWMPNARRLHDALIAPIEEHLRKLDVRTLVWIPDGALRNVPPAALHDGKQFLIEKYSLAIAPNVTLTDPAAVTRKDTRMLVGALSEPVQGFPALPEVRSEVDGIMSILRSDVLLDDNFVKQSFTARTAAGPYRIVHLASHGVFSPQSAQSFILTYEDRINLNELETMLRPRKYDDAPVELLCLSACETAAGDDRAALGLAGIAVKCGARAALASLWRVSDKVSSRLMVDFYRHLFSTEGISKAEALRQAQIAILKDKTSSHPAFWSQYLLIGNWL